LEYTLNQNQLDKIEDILRQDLVDVGVHCVFLIDMPAILFRTWITVKSSMIFILLPLWLRGISVPLVRWLKSSVKGNFHYCFIRGRRKISILIK